MLWLRLRSLTQALGDAWGLVMVHCLTLMALMAMTSWFGLLSALRLGLYRRILATSATIFVSGATINSVAGHSGHAVRNVLTTLRQRNKSA